jgi:3-hydroxyacyl-CoA dehydrogenase / enoyl-CoA hydratase / 3-hydroxybutyryl-CoA epimerase
MLYESPSYRLLADDQVYTLWIDFRGRSSHRITLASLNELSLVLDRLAALPVPDVLVIRSSRPGTFLEEFDSGELVRFHSSLEFAALVRRGQDVARKLKQFEFPTLAVIEGRCAGGGMELALACDFRLGVEYPDTRFESVEVSRGLVPAWGGTVRLPRLIGLPASLRIVVEGETCSAVKARELGLLDRLVAPQQLSVELMSFIDRLRENPSRSLSRKLREFSNGCSSAILGRARLRQAASRHASGQGDELSLKTRLLGVFESGLHSEGVGLAAERSAISQLSGTPSTAHLLELHRASIALFTESAFQPLPRRIGIVGGGHLGSALAFQLANRGHEVIIQERNATEAANSQRRSLDHLAEAVRRREIAPRESARIAGSIRTTAEWIGFENADFAIEAAYEDPGLKKNLFHELEQRTRPRVILATTSTTVMVDSIQTEAIKPGRIVGLHFSDLDGLGSIAEVIVSAATDAGTLSSLADWARRWGFLPIRVADRPGRLIELIRLSYLSEAVSLVGQGLPINKIDAAARQFGMKRGPLEWCDEIGLDRLAERTAQLQLARGDYFARNLLFQRLLSYGCVGKAVGEGFYRYGRTLRPNNFTRSLLWQDLEEDAVAPYVFDPEESLREGIERLVLRTVNEAAAALVDEPDSDPAMMDLALTRGMGWAPQRGGPLRYADDIGLSLVVDRLSFFAERYGERFQPCDELVRRAEAGESFYGGEQEPRVELALPLKLVG